MTLNQPRDLTATSKSTDSIKSSLAIRAAFTKLADNVEKVNRQTHIDKIRSCKSNNLNLPLAFEEHSTLKNNLRTLEYVQSDSEIDIIECAQKVLPKENIHHVNEIGRSSSCYQVHIQTNYFIFFKH